jgi:PilZ domain-containing protein
MQHLTGEWFENLIRSVNTRETGDQRRRVPRIGVRFSAEMFQVDGDGVLPPVTIRIRDLSPLGLGFTHTRRLRKGTRFIVQLPQEELEPLRILCEVRNCTTVADQLFTIGAEFVQIGLKSHGGLEGDVGAGLTPAAAASKPASPAQPAAAGAAEPKAGKAEAEPVPPAAHAEPVVTAAGGASQSEIDSMAAQVRKAMFE